METTRVEVISAHFYDRDRQPGERYDCANQYLPVLIGRKLVQVVDQQVEAEEILESVSSDSTIGPESVYSTTLVEPVLKRKRGRPFGSHGPYKKRSVVSETSVDR